MKFLWLFIVLTALAFIQGCAEDEAAVPGDEPFGDQKPGKEDLTVAGKGEDLGLPCPVEIDQTEYVSEDGKVTIEIERLLLDDRIPEEVSRFFSTEENNQANGDEDMASGDNGIYFESSQIILYQEEVHYLALFLSIKSIEEGFLKIPHGFKDEQPVLLSQEGSVFEKIITQFKYTGSAEDYSGYNDLPAGSEGVVVFAYPPDETPAEVHYIYSLQDEIANGVEKGIIVVPLSPLINN